MNAKLSDWLNKGIGLFRPRKPPSPLVRKIGRAVQIIFAAAFCAFAVWRVWLYRDINTRFARLRAGGFPISGAELNVWPHPGPDTENGALVMTQAFALFRTFPDRRSNEVLEAKILYRTNEWSLATHALVEEYVQTNATALAKVHDALRFSQFRYPVDYSYGLDTQFPHLGPLKELAYVAALKAVLDSGEGNAEDWPPQVELQLKIAGTLDQDPAVISHLVRNGIISRAAKVAERSLNEGTPSDTACLALQTKFIRAGETNLLPFALAGERARVIPQFRLSWKEIDSAGDDSEGEGHPRQPTRYAGKPNPFLWFIGFFERDLDFYLKMMEKSISLASSPLPESLALTNFSDMADGIARKRIFVFSSLLLPSLSRVVIRDASTLASCELAATALAVERFRHAQGRLPDNLGELTPQYLASVPVDPFDGAPLRYRRLAKGYVVYSVGADGRDDGGRERPWSIKSTDTNTYDITFIVER